MSEQENKQADAQQSNQPGNFAQERTREYSRESPADFGGAAAATASAKQPWATWTPEMAESMYTPFERAISNFINRRNDAHEGIRIRLSESEKVSVLRFYAGNKEEGNNLGSLKVLTDSGVEKLVTCNDAIFEQLLAKITGG